MASDVLRFLIPKGAVVHWNGQPFALEDETKVSGQAASYVAALTGAVSIVAAPAEGTIVARPYVPPPRPPDPQGAPVPRTEGVPIENDDFEFPSMAAPVDDRMGPPENATAIPPRPLAPVPVAAPVVSTPQLPANVIERKFVRGHVVESDRADRIKRNAAGEPVIDGQLAKLFINADGYQGAAVSEDAGSSLWTSGLAKVTAPTASAFLHRGQGPTLEMVMELRQPSRVGLEPRWWVASAKAVA